MKSKTKEEGTVAKCERAHGVQGGFSKSHKLSDEYVVRTLPRKMYV